MRGNDIYDLCHRIRSLLCQKVHDIMYKGGEREVAVSTATCVLTVFKEMAAIDYAFTVMLRKGKITASAYRVVENTYGIK